MAGFLLSVFRTSPQVRKQEETSPYKSADGQEVDYEIYNFDSRHRSFASSELDDLLH